jgi:RNA polymerase sigma-70 factor (ECF subfamily)
MSARGALRRSRQSSVESEIVRLLESRDLRGAATLVIREYGPQILGYLTVVTKDADDADEAFGRFCEEMWKNLGGFRRESSVLTWAYRVAWTAALRLTQDGYRRRGRRLETAELSGLMAYARSSLAPHLRESRKDWLHRLRAQLTPAEQTLLTLRIDRAMSWRDVAAVLAEDDGPDEVVLRKRFDRLKRKLEDVARAEGLLE